MNYSALAESAVMKSCSVVPIPCGPVTGFTAGVLFVEVPWHLGDLPERQDTLLFRILDKEKGHLR